jgi:hypothetical protein
MVAQARKIKADCRLGRADLFLLQLKQSAQRLKLEKLHALASVEEAYRPPKTSRNCPTAASGLSCVGF